MPKMRQLVCLMTWLILLTACQGRVNIASGHNRHSAVGRPRPSRRHRGQPRGYRNRHNEGDRIRTDGDTDNYTDS